MQGGRVRRVGGPQQEDAPPQHVGALFAAVERYQVAELDLGWNQLGDEGGALVAAALKTNTTLTRLECTHLGRRSNLGQ